MELLRALAVLAEPPGPETPRLAGLLELPSAPEPWQYAELFLAQLYPYASVYLGGEGKLGGEARDRVAGLWRVLGETPPDEPDHLALLLGQYARLAELEDGAETRAAAGWQRARTTLLHEHILSWLPLWLDKLERIAAQPYRAWGRLVGEVLRAEDSRAAPPTGLPMHLRDAPRLQPPAEVGGVVFLEQLLAPVRAGFILTRSDLQQCAESLGLGLRAGERSYALRALLSQDEAATLAWLGELAASEAGRRDGRNGVDAFWRQRASDSSTLLAEAAAAAD